MILHFANLSEKAIFKFVFWKLPRHSTSAQHRIQPMVKFCLTQHSLHFFAVLVSVGHAVQLRSLNTSGSKPLPPVRHFSH